MMQLSNYFAITLNQIWEFMSSGKALAIYAGVLGVVLLILIAALMGRDNRTSQVVINSAQGTVLQAGGVTVAGSTVATQDPKVEKAQEDEGEIAEEENEGKGRFCKLCNLDEIRVSLQRANYDDHITLRQFCENFRNYAASRLKLYYDIDDIRR
ncbi:MAG: hypothetical protein J6B45_03615, partial [Clostridia bacterium]|nr:hypothetical protein [Clostridia bacterium]